MPPRVSCRKIEAKELFPGAEVCKGRDWQWLQQDGKLKPHSDYDAVYFGVSFPSYFCTLYNAELNEFY